MKRLRHILQESDGLIGPHEGKELELMLGGTKPAAMISDDELKKFQPHIKSGKFVYRAIPHPKSPKIMMHFVAQNEENLDKAITSFKGLWDHPNPAFNYEGHERFGKALGYSEEAIAAYIKQQKGKE